MIKNGAMELDEIKILASRVKDAYDLASYERGHTDNEAEIYNEVMRFLTGEEISLAKGGSKGMFGIDPELFRLMVGELSTTRFDQDHPGKAAEWLRSRLNGLGIEVLKEGPAGTHGDTSGSMGPDNDHPEVRFPPCRGRVRLRTKPENCFDFHRDDLYQIEKGDLGSQDDGIKSRY